MEETALPENLEQLPLYELVELLDKTMTPAPISYFPQTLFWQLSAFFIVVLLLTWSFRHYRNFRANAYRRAALKELERLKASKRSDFAPALSALLKRVALTAFSRSEIAGLVGADWLSFLDQCYPGDAFSKGVGAALGSDIYALDYGCNEAALTALAREWILTHSCRTKGRT